jgi:hypothetical protein
MTSNQGLTHISASLADALKEVSRRVELRQRLEAEWGREVTDDEFLAIAESGGIRI